MKQPTTTNIAVLPVGEFESEPVREKFETTIQAIQPLTTNLRIVPAVSNEEAAHRSALEISEDEPDLLVIIVSRGLSARIIETTAQASRAPCLVLPLQGNYALPSSVLAAGACQQRKVPIELLYGPPAQPEFIRRLSRVVKAANAYLKIKNSRIGIIGELFPNLVSCRYDAAILRGRLGITLLPFSFECLRSAIRTIPDDAQTLWPLNKKIAGSYQINPADKEALDAGVRMHTALKRMAAEHGIDGFATECWSGFPREVGMNPCLGFIEDDYELACEGDVMLCISLLIARYLTGRRAFAGDLFDIDQTGILTLIHCGAPASLGVKEGDAILAKSPLAQERGFETISCRPALEPGPVTVFRFYGKECDKLHLAFGELTRCDRSSNLTVQVRLSGNRWDFLDQCFGNHYLAAAGDIRDELKLLCKWLGIEVFET